LDALGPTDLPSTVSMLTPCAAKLTSNKAVGKIHKFNIKQVIIKLIVYLTAAQLPGDNMAHTLGTIGITDLSNIVAHTMVDLYTCVFCEHFERVGAFRLFTFEIFQCTE